MNDKKQVAYMTTGNCIFRGVWHAYGDIIYLDEKDEPNHAKLKKLTEAPNKNRGKIYDATGNAMKETDIGKTFAGILR